LKKRSATRKKNRSLFLFRGGARVNIPSRKKRKGKGVELRWGKKEKKKWRDFPTTERGLSSRGKREKGGSSNNEEYARKKTAYFIEVHPGRIIQSKITERRRKHDQAMSKEKEGEGKKEDIILLICRQAFSPNSFREREGISGETPYSMEEGKREGEEENLFCPLQNSV